MHSGDKKMPLCTYCIRLTGVWNWSFGWHLMRLLAFYKPKFIKFVVWQIEIVKL